jgi:hypothetical protein
MGLPAGRDASTGTAVWRPRPAHNAGASFFAPGFTDFALPSASSGLPTIAKLDLKLSCRPQVDLAPDLWARKQMGDRLRLALTIAISLAISGLLVFAAFTQWWVQ